MTTTTKHITKPTHRFDVAFIDVPFADKPKDGLSSEGCREM